MKVMLIGSGGREHALAWKLSQDTTVEHIYCLPGNPGISTVSKCENVPFDIGDLNGLADFAEQHQIDLTVVGPEAPLVAGIADVFFERKLAVFRAFFIILQYVLGCDAGFMAFNGLSCSGDGVDKDYVSNI